MLSPFTLLLSNIIQTKKKKKKHNLGLVFLHLYMFLNNVSGVIKSTKVSLLKLFTFMNILKQQEGNHLLPGLDLIKILINSSN